MNECHAKQYNILFTLIYNYTAWHLFVKRYFLICLPFRTLTGRIHSTFFNVYHYQSNLKNGQIQHCSASSLVIIHSLCRYFHKYLAELRVLVGTLGLQTSFH